MTLHTERDCAWCQDGENYIQQLARISSIDYKFKPTDANAESYLDIKIKDNVFYLNTSGHIDLEAERARKAKHTAKLEQELASLTSRLNNPSFADKAPAKVVAEVKARIDELKSLLRL